jgi:hypothetical protein
MDLGWGVRATVHGAWQCPIGRLRSARKTGPDFPNFCQAGNRGFAIGLVLLMAGPESFASVNTGVRTPSPRRTPLTADSNSASCQTARSRFPAAASDAAHTARNRWKSLHPSAASINYPPAAAPPSASPHSSRPFELKLSAQYSAPPTVHHLAQERLQARLP